MFVAAGLPNSFQGDFENKKKSSTEFQFFSIFRVCAEYQTRTLSRPEYASMPYAPSSATTQVTDQKVQERVQNIRQYCKISR